MEGDQPVGSAFTSTCLITDRRTVDVTRTKFGSYDEQEDPKILYIYPKLYAKFHEQTYTLTNTRNSNVWQRTEFECCGE